MTRKELQEQNERLRKLYCGMLFTSDECEEGEPVPLFYRFSCPEFATLRHTYGLESIAGRGSELSMALRLCRWMAPELVHEGDFSLSAAAEMPINALSLLEYCFGKRDKGINCACKAKILVECCLSLGIHARRVGLYPNSPYDTDNHVVAEVFDSKLHKWCLLDPTNGGFVSDGVQPLSCLEMRKKLALQQPCSVVLAHQSERNLSKLIQKNEEWNIYYAKNLYYFTVETVSQFGSGGARDAYLIPRGFDCHAREVRSAQYLLEKATEWGWDAAALENIARWRDRASERAPLIGTVALWAPPVIRK